MKVYRLVAAGLALGLLTGCASLLERSYTTSGATAASSGKVRPPLPCGRKTGRIWSTIC